MGVYDIRGGPINGGYDIRGTLLGSLLYDIRESYYLGALLLAVPYFRQPP